LIGLGSSLGSLQRCHVSSRVTRVLRGAPLRDRAGHCKPPGLQGPAYKAYIHTSERSVRARSERFWAPPGGPQVGGCLCTPSRITEIVRTTGHGRAGFSRAEEPRGEGCAQVRRILDCADEERRKGIPLRLRFPIVEPLFGSCPKASMKLFSEGLFLEAERNDGGWLLLLRTASRVGASE